jgi:hypothetical protein
MNAKRLITSCCLLAIMACGTAFAQQGKLTSGPYQGPKLPMGAQEAPAAGPFYTNLVTDPCTSCNYSSANGFLLLGPNNCYAPTAGQTQWLAYPFNSTKAGAVRQVILAITNDTALCTPTSSKFTVAIYSDACTGAPGTQIGSSVVATAGISPCTVAVANFAHANVTLVAQTNYWVVVTTSTASTQIGTTAVWWEANGAASSVNFNDGNGWQASPLGGPGGFTVQ